jgi:hypothetical protein
MEVRLCDYSQWNPLVKARTVPSLRLPVSQGVRSCISLRITTRLVSSTAAELFGVVFEEQSVFVEWKLGIA